MAAGGADAAAPAERTLDRGRFEESFEVPAIRVPARRTGQFLGQLRHQLLNLRRRKNVEAIAGESANLILLSRSFTDGISQLPASEKAWLEGQLGADIWVTSYTVRLGYDYFSTEEILTKMLPAGVEVPGAFEQAGHICHLNLRDSQLPYRFLIAQVILDKCKSLRTVVNKVGKIETEFRTFPMEHLAGDESTVVQLKEQGCIFEFDFKDVYWNSRLQMEHGRLIEALFLRRDSDGGGRRPVLADATCGVGPFSVPLAKQGHQLVAHANDLNPESIRWLRRNAEVNKLPEVLEVQGTPPFSDSHAPPKQGSKLVIHAPGDARVFIQSLQEQRHPVTHAIFNLPATGLELLDCYRGLKFEEEGLPRPMVACYTFSDGLVDSTGPDGCVAELLDRLTAALGLPAASLRHTHGQDRAAVQSPAGGHLLPLPSPQVDEMVRAAREPGEGVAAIRFIRNVSPTRNMFCVCFRVPKACAEAGEPVEKRARVA